MEVPQFLYRKTSEYQKAHAMRHGLNDLYLTGAINTRKGNGFYYNTFHNNCKH